MQLEVEERHLEVEERHLEEEQRLGVFILLTLTGLKIMFFVISFP